MIRRPGGSAIGDGGPARGHHQSIFRSRTAAASFCAAIAPQVALAWLLERSPVMLPIPGTSSVRHLDENVAAALLELGDQDFRALDHG